jgi:excisionase family DNA binding protein
VQPDVYTTAGVAVLLNVHIMTLYTLIARGRVKPARLGRRLFAWTPADVEAARRLVVPGRGPGRPRKAVRHHA